MAFYSIYSEKDRRFGQVRLNGPYPDGLENIFYIIMHEPLMEITTMALFFIKIENKSEYPIRYIYMTASYTLYLEFDRDEAPFVRQNYICPHQHNCYELFYVFEGTCHNIAEGNRKIYRKNDGYFQKPYVVRCDDFQSDFYGVELWLTRDYIEEIFNPVNWHVEGISRTDADYSDKALRYLLQKDYTDFYLRDHFRADYYLSKNTCIFEGIVQLLLNSSTAGKDALLTGCICRLLDQLNDSSCYDIVA